MPSCDSGCLHWGTRLDVTQQNRIWSLPNSHTPVTSLYFNICKCHPYPLAAEPGVQVAAEDLGQHVAHRETGEDKTLLFDRPVELGVVLLKVSLKFEVVKE